MIPYKILNVFNLFLSLVSVFYLLHLFINYDTPQKHARTLFFFFSGAILLFFVQVYTLFFPVEVNWLLKSHGTIFCITVYSFVSELKTESIKKHVKKRYRPFRHL